MQIHSGKIIRTVSTAGAAALTYAKAPTVHWSCNIGADVIQ